MINKTRAKEMLAKYQTDVQVDEAFAALQAYWKQLLARYTVDSADEKVNRMVNTWNQYQCMVTFNMSRSASYYESGIGRGMGFRDSCQDLLGFVHLFRTVQESVSLISLPPSSRTAVLTISTSL